MRSSRSKAQSLQQAASTIFVLMGLLPFLIFVYLVVMLNGMQNWRVQLGLGIALALAFSLLGTNTGAHGRAVAHAAVNSRRSCRSLPEAETSHSAHPGTGCPA